MNPKHLKTNRLNKIAKNRVEPGSRTPVLIGRETVETWVLGVLTQCLWRGRVYTFGSPEDMIRKIRWFQITALKSGQQTLEL